MLVKIAFEIMRGYTIKSRHLFFYNKVTLNKPRISKISITKYA
ncbi:hypothetical protein NTG1052_210001 [Candidatus Nitrotoga sp. 1052]|nr:hypothetical protein NTG1052_210001 [Candidatus Nitrotoga sp. 1052]